MLVMLLLIEVLIVVLLGVGAVGRGWAIGCLLALA